MKKPITFREYQLLAARTSGAKDSVFCPTPFAPLPIISDPKFQVRLRTAVLGLVGEIGEFADLLKKVVGHGHEPDHDKFLKEGGDVYWYLAELASCLGIAMADDEATSYQARAAEERLGGPLGEEENPYEVATDSVLEAAGYAGGMAAVVLSLLSGGGPVIEPEAGWADTVVVLAKAGTAMAVALYVLRLPLGPVLEANIEKLKKRYPEGFSSERSLDRPPE